MTIGIDARMMGNRHGGIGRYIFELAKNLLLINSSDSFLIFYNPGNCDEGEVDSLKSFSQASLIPVNIRHYSIGEQLKFYKILNKYSLDLVHFPNFNVPLLYKKPFVVTIHDLVHHKISGAKKSRLLHFLAYKKIIQSAADRARLIITVSEYSKRDIIKLLNQPVEKISVIYEGVNLQTDIPDAKIEAVKKTFMLRRPYFLFVGVLERKKNIVNLTRGFDVFIKKFGLDMDLVIVGKTDKHYPDIKHQALDIKASDRLVFTGYVDDTDLAALYKGANAYVSASLHEGFGLPGVEAMQFGLPLIVSNIEVFNEIYDNAAVYFNPLDPEDIAEKMHLVVKDPEFQEKLRNQSLKRGALFEWDKTARQTLELYKAILNR